MAVASDKPVTSKPAPEAAAKPAVQLATPVKAAPAAEAAPLTKDEPKPAAAPKAAPKPVAKKAAPKKVVAKKVAAKKAAPKAAAPAAKASDGFKDVASLVSDQFGFFNVMGFDMAKSYEDVIAFNKGNLEALAQSTAILSEGLQGVSSEVAAFAQTSVKENIDATQALLGCKDPKEFTELQAKIAKESYDKFVSEASKISDASAKLAEEAWAPITGRVTVAFDAVKGQTA